MTRSDLVRAHATRSGPRRRRAPARPGRRPDARVRARPTWRRSRCSRSRARRARRGGTLPVRVQRGQRGRGRGLPRRAAAVPRDRGGRRGRRSRPRTARPRAIWPSSSRRTRDARAARERGRAGRVSIFVSLLGLAFLILVHEAGHFFVARGVGMNPRKFYLGFPPAVVKTKRNGIEYGVGAIPLGGYVKIPGMHRPARGRPRRPLRPRDRGGAAARPARRAICGAHLDESDYDGAAAALERARAALRDASISPLARRSAERGLDRDPGRARAGRLLARSRPGSGSRSSSPARPRTSCSRSSSSPRSSCR